MAADDTVTGNEDTSIIGQATATDDDGDAITFSKATDPANGTVSVASGGSFTYTPTPNFNGVDSFEVSADDGNGGLGLATITLNVLPQNDDPVAADLSVSGNENASIAGQVTATDVDGDTVTYAKGSDPTDGSVTVNPDGSFSYVPNAGFSGFDSFIVIADDGNGGTDTATVSITVNATPKVARYTDASFTTLIQTYQDLAPAVADAAAGQGIKVLAPAAIGSAGSIPVTTNALTIAGNIPYDATFVMGVGVSDLFLQGFEEFVVVFAC